MKIGFLELAPKDLPADMCSDYQLDMLFHGLIKSGHTVYSAHDHWWMFKSEKQKRPNEFKKIWGKGFTIYGILEDSDKNNLRSLDFSACGGSSLDLWIVGLHHTVAGDDGALGRALDYLDNTLHIPRPQTVIVDGWDRPYFNKEFARNYTYFKRELYDDDIHACKPISFAFPAEKIHGTSHAKDVIMLKKKDIAPLIPVNQSIDPSFMSTYIYDNEQDYYQMYRDSEFGLTSKKGGWDTLRHYEMVANGCIPLFVDIEECPKKTLHLWPKELLKEVKRKEYVTLNYKDGTYGHPKYLKDCSCVDLRNAGKITVPKTPCYAAEMIDDIHYMSEELVDWLKEKGTTKYLAEYVINNA